MLACLGLCALVAALPDPGRPSLRTVAERTHFARTGRYEEVVALANEYPRQYPGWVSSTTVGVSAQGRPILALIAGRGAPLDPVRVRADGRPVVLIQAGLHAGEIDGKDAGFLVLRDLLEGRIAPGLLDRVVWIFLPVLNVDGHERFGPNQRPNQNGPLETGWRTTAQNLNINRDFTKLDAPETQALLRFLGRWDPVLFVDLHTTDGSRHRHAISIQVEPGEAGAESLQLAGRALREAVVSGLVRRGHAPLWFYPSFREADNPAAGFEVGVDPPRYGLGYWSVRDRFAALFEAHSWNEYGERVRVLREAVGLVAEAARRDARSWRAQVDAADRDAQNLPGTRIPVSFTTLPDERRIDVLGYEYSRVPSAISGHLRTIYDVKRPTVWRVPLRARVVADAWVELAAAGYVVPREQHEVVERLRAHGFRMRPLEGARGVAAQAFQARDVSFSAEPYEGRHPVWFDGTWTSARVDLSEGSWWVPSAQPGARLLAHLLEPLAPDSFVGWGFMSAIFERKEHLEGYVLEPFAEELLRRDPAVAEAFNRRLLEDAEFARDPELRLEFFHRLHPSWDPAIGRYPILRFETPPPGVTLATGSARSGP